MRQSGHWQKKDRLGKDQLADLLISAIEKLDVGQAKRDVLPFVTNNDTLDIWSREFFEDICSRIQMM